MSEHTTKYVMLFRRPISDAAAAARKIHEMPGVKVIRQSGDTLLLVEVAADDVDFPRRASEEGVWTISQQRIYQLC